MKIQKQFIIVISAIVITSFCFTACKDDGRKHYYGTWVFAGFGSQLTFSANKFVFLDENNELGFTVSPVTWTPVVNNNDFTKEDYPTGFKISGYISEHHGDIMWQTGSYHDEDWAFFIHNDKQHMIEQGDHRFWVQELTRYDPAGKNRD